MKLQEPAARNTGLFQIHSCTCFLLWIIPHLLHKAFYFKKTPLTLFQELTEEEIQLHPKEDCHPGGQSVLKDSGSKLCFSATIPLDVSRQISKPSISWTLLLPTGVKLTVKKNLVRDSGIQVRSTEYSQYRGISQISSSEDMF